MAEQSGTNQWNWQWTAAFVIMISFSVSAILWTRGFQIIGSVITLAATLLGMYVIYKG